MKKMFILILLVFSERSFGQSASDTLAIKETTLNYVEGFYNSDPQRMSKALDPELAKRIIVKGENGDFMVRNMGYSELLFNTRKFKKSEDKEPLKSTVTIYDISRDIASVKVTTNKLKFFDYIHLGKINGEWKIINVLWARTE